MSKSAAATQLSAHPINEMLRRLIEASESAAYAETRDVLDENRRSVLDRVFVFARRLRDLIANAVDADVSFNGLNVITNSLTNTLGEVSAFYSDKNPGHIDNALTHLDSATSTAAWTFFDVPPKGSRTHGESIAAVQNAASEAIEKLRNQNTSVEAQIAKTQSQLDAQQQAIAAATEQITASKAANDAAVSEIRSDFQTIEADFRKKAEQAEKARTADFEARSKKFESDASAALKKLADHEAAAKRIVQIVGNVGVTGNYQNRAEQERWQANLWRWITLALFAAGVVLVTVNLILNFKGKIDLTALIARFAIAVTIALPALYTARESARHRTNADRAKQTELELASLGPFLETLPEGDRQTIIGELATHYFGREVDAHEVHAPISVEEARKALEAAANLATKVKGT